MAAYHLSVWWGLWPSGDPWNMAFARLGNFGVSAFFLLSGFLLARQSPWPALVREGAGRYALRRWLRLAPLFYLVVLLNLVLRLGMGPEASVRMVAENLTLTFGAFHPNHALVTGGWYVGLVALAFALWPAVAWLRERLGWPAPVLLAAGLTAASLPWTLHRVPEAVQWERFHTYVQPGNQMFLLAWGAVLAEVHGRAAFRLRPWTAAALALPLLFLMVRPAPVFHDHFDVLAGAVRYRHLALAAGLVLLASLTGGAPGRAGRALARVGAWSYGIYLLHPFVHRALLALLPPGAAPRGPFLLSLALSVVAGAAAHRWLEQPLARLGSRRRPA